MLKQLSERMDKQPHLIQIFTNNTTLKTLLSSLSICGMAIGG